MSRQVYSSAVYKENACVMEMQPQKYYTARDAKSQTIGWFSRWRGSEAAASFCATSTRLSLHGPPAPQGCQPSPSLCLYPKMQPPTARPGVFQSPEEPPSPADPGAKPRGPRLARTVLSSRGRPASAWSGHWHLR